MVGQIEILTRGGVYLGKLNPAKHNEIGKVRPVIILNSQLILDSMPPIIFICPLSCSGLLSKREWLAFVGKNGLKLNDFINSPWLTLFDSIKLTSS